MKSPWCSLLFLPALVAACDESAPRAGAPSVASSATPSAAAPVASQKITVRFDGRARDVPVTKIQRNLADLLPPEGRDPKVWRELRADSADGKRTLAVSDFSKKYREHDVRVFVDDEGRPAVGIFRRVRPDMAAHVKAKLKEPHVVLVDAATIDIRTEVTKREAPKKQRLSMVVAGAEQELAAAKLEALDMAMPPGKHQRGRRRNRGWRLRDVVGLAADLSKVARVELVDGDGDELVVDGDELRGKGSVVLLRYNNRGELGATSWTADGESRRLRGVVKLVVDTK
jgi:hypothetical protein